MKMMGEIDWTAVGALGFYILLCTMCIIAVAVDR